GLSMLPPQDRLPGGLDLIRPAQAERVGSVMQKVRVLLADLQERLGEGVERLLAFRLRRLDHERLCQDEREIYRRRVVAVVKQALGDVHGADALLALQKSRRRNELVHAALAVGHLVSVLDVAQQIVGVEDRVLADGTQSLRPQRANVAVAAEQNADI